jgi:hypothetical protein
MALRRATPKSCWCHGFHREKGHGNLGVQHALTML